MAFVLFLLLNAVLFIRPEELFPELAGLQLYQALILACLAVAGLSVLRQLSWQSLSRQPITLCVVGLLPAVILSQLSHFQFGLAANAAYEFVKVVLYYLLFVGIVTTPARLKWFLASLLVFIIVLSSLALLQYHGAVNIQALSTLEQKHFDVETGETGVFLRLQSTGIYNDPNDLCLILVVGMAVSLYLGLDSSRGPWRFVWLSPLPLFGYALMLTQSRGGMLAMAAGFLVFCWARFGWKKSVLLAGLGVPVLLFMFAGRQTNIDLGNKEDTAQQRIQLWSEGLTLMRGAPVFGIGYQQYAEEVGLVAHNSYVHAFTELGLFGGALFVSAFYLGFLALRRLSRPGAMETTPELMRFRPYLLGLAAGYAVGLWSLSRCYIAPTYMVLGLVNAFASIVESPRQEILPPVRGHLLGRLALVTVASLAAIYIFVRVLTNLGAAG